MWHLRITDYSDEKDLGFVFKTFPKSRFEEEFQCAYMSEPMPLKG